MLEQIFMQVIDMSKTASIAILFVLIARLFLRRFPKYISYGLWIVVFFRLVCPYSFESIISFVPTMEPTSYERQQNSKGETTFFGAGEMLYQAAEDFITGEESIYLKHKPDIDPEGNIIDDTSMFFVFFIMLGRYVWLIGIAAMLFYSLYTYLNIKEKLITAIRVTDNIYNVDNITSPFVMGVIRPKIYLPYGLAGDEQQYILMHEQYHIKRFDYIIKLMAYAVLCIHWFNPLVWLAFVEFSKDMEMSCDEAVVKKSGEEIRANYAASLLNLATEDRIIQSTPLAFGEGDTKSRIKNIAIIKNISFPKVIAIMTLSGIFMLCLAANPKEMETALLKEKLEALNQKNKIENVYTEYMHCGNYGVFEITDGILFARNALNDFGQLGLNRIDDLNVIYEKIQIAEHVKHFDYNLETLIYVTEDGKLYGLGKNNYGQLGQDIDKYHVGYGYASKSTCITNPILIMEDVVYAVLGKSHLLILKNDHSLWGIGRNENNELGIGKKEEVRYYYKPQKIMSNIRYIAASGQNSAAINKKQQLYVWGDNSHGQIARDGKTSNASMPQLVMRSVNSVYFYLNKNGMLHWKANEPPSKDEIYQELK